MASLNQLSEFTSNIIAPKGKASKDIMEDILLNRAISKNVFTGNRILVTSEKGVSDSSDFSPNNLNHLDGISHPIQTQINDIKSNISSNLPNIVDIHSRDLIISASNIQNQVSSHLSSITFDNIANGTQNKFIVNDTIQGDINVTGRITANNLEVTGTYTKYVTDKYVADNIIVNDGNTTITDVSQLQPGSALTLTQNGLQNILEVYSQKETTTNNLTIKQNGRVGMGIVNPTEILDIRGDMHFSGTMNGVTSNEFSALANTKGNLQEQINTLSSGFVGNNTSIDLINQITSNIVATVENKVSQQITISSNNAIHYYEDICENKQDNLVFGNGLSLVNDTLELTANITTAWTDNSNHISFGNVHVYNDQIIIGDNTSVVSDTAVETTPVFTSGLKYPREPLVGDTTTYTDGTVVKIRVQSSYHVNYQKHYLFNGNDNGWASPSFTYTSGVANNTYRTGVANEDIYPGEYVMIDLGEEIILDYIKIYPRTGDPSSRQQKAPNEFRIYASNTNTSYDDINDPSWVLLYEGNNPTDGTSAETETYIVDNNTQSYRHYVMIINKVFNADMLWFSELELYSKIQTNQTASFGDVTTDMYIWYKYDGDFNDASGNNNHAVAFNSPIFNDTEKKVGTHSVQFAGGSGYSTSPQYLKLPSTDFSLWDGFTVSCWVMFEDNGDYGRVIDFADGQANNNIILTRRATTNQISLDVWHGSSITACDTVNNVIVLNTWMHITWVITKEPKWKLYINGNLQTLNSSIFKYPRSASYNDCYIAKSHWINNAYFKGKMDDFRLYKRALTESEISELYNYVPGAVGSEPNYELTTVPTEEIIKYPRENMTSGEFTYVSDGTVVRCQASSKYPGTNYNVHYLFDGTKQGEVSAANQWASANIGLEKNEWIMIDLGEKIILKQTMIYPLRANIFRQPRKFKIYGTNDINDYLKNDMTGTWNLIYEGTNPDIDPTIEVKIYDISTNVLEFRYYSLVISNTYNNEIIHFEEWELHGHGMVVVKSSVSNNQVATLDSLDNKQTSLRWMGISRMLFNNFQPNVVTVSDQYGKVNVSDISVDSLNTLSDTRSNINTQINTLSNNHQTLRNNLQSANNTWNTNTSNYIKNTVQTAINTISTTKLSTDVVFSTGFIQDGNNISLDSEMTISSEAVNNTSSTYWELHYKYGSNIPPEIIINNSLINNTSSGSSFGDVTTDMMAWYKFDGDVTDSSGNGNDLTGGTGTSFVEGKIGTNSISFPKTTTQGLTSSVDLSGNKSFSIAFWSYRNNDGDYDFMISTERQVQSMNKILIIGYRNTNEFTFSFFGGNNLDTVVQNDANVWVYWTVTYNSTDLRREIYKNGVLIANDTASGAADFTGNTLNIGYYYLFPFNGKIDDFRVYNRALTASEVADLYNYVPGAVGTTTTSGSATIEYVSGEKYPREPLVGYQTIYTDGTVVNVKESSIFENGFVYYLFDDSLTSAWSSHSQSYNASTSYANFERRTGYNGEYFIIDLGEKIILDYIKIYPDTGFSDFPKMRPEEFRLYASNTAQSYDDINDSDWILMYEGDGDPNNTGENDRFQTPDEYIITDNVTEYRYYAFIVNKLAARYSSFMRFTGFEFFSKKIVETQVSVPFYTDTQNLLLWYKFDKNNFTTNSGNLGSAYDVTQNSTLVDTSIRMKGDGAANLDGSYMIIQSDLDFTANTIISICFWTKITQLNSQWDVVLYKYMSASNAIIIQRNAATNYWSIQFGAANVTTDGFLNDFTLDDTSWRHYCFTFVKTGNNVTFKIFKNAGTEPVFTQEVTNTWPSVPIGKVSIGDPTYPLRHFIDDLRFYDRELIAEELYQLYKYEPPVVDYITYKNTSEVVPDKYLKYYPDKLAIAYNLQNISKVSIIHNDAIEEPTAIPGSGGYKYFAFTSTTGINSITFDRDTVCDVLVVGGGGAGYNDKGGGGGGGAVVHIINGTFKSGIYDITVGEGGIGTLNSKGNNSTIIGQDISIIAEGGGKGGQYAADGVAIGQLKAAGTGGSGGGGGCDGVIGAPYTFGAGTGTESSLGGFSGTIYGNKGGDGLTRNSSSNGTAGGGGGAGEEGGDGNIDLNNIGGNGGDGIQINIDGNNYYWGGGGGGSTLGNKSGNGGKGGGGGGAVKGDQYSVASGYGLGGGYSINSGGNAVRSVAGHGGENTGGGGGGGGHAAGPLAGNGGSGIVIIRWYSPESEYNVTEVDELVTKQDAIYFGNGLKYNSTTKELTAGGWNDKKTHVSHGDVSFAQNTLSLYKGERVNTYTAFQPSRKYPDVSLTAATTVSPYTSQNHIVQWSSEEATTNYRGHHLFNGDRADVGWISGQKYYKDGDTIPAGSVAGDAIDTSSYIGDDSDNYGEWVKIELDKVIYLSYVQIYERRITGLSHRNPVFYVIYGSNDGNTWTQLIVNKTVEATYSTDADRVHTSEKVVSTQKYKHFAITVTKQGGTGGDCGFAELELYGNEHINVSTSVITESLNTAKLGSIETNNVITKNISSIDSGPINLGKHIEIHNTTDTMSSQHMMMSSNITDVSTEDKSYCMRAKRDIWIDGADIVWTSDERIKKDIQDIDDDGALQKILAIEPKTYKYIDHLERGKNKVYGFISQQVREVIPEATTQTKKYIPNIYKYCPYFGKTIVLPKDFDISTIVTTYNGKLLSDKLRLISSSGQATDVSFVMNGDADSRYTMTITGRIPGDGRDVFVYGTEIDDMTTIDKSYIYTLNVCATQTLSRKTDIIDANSSNLLSRTSELEQRIADIESKMSQ